MGMCTKLKIKKNMKKIIFTVLSFLILSCSVFALGNINRAEEIKNIDFLGENINLKLNTYNKKVGSEVLNLYKDDYNNEYIYKNNKLVGYLQNKEINDISSNLFSTYKKSAINYRLKADEYAKIFIDENLTNFNNYTFEKESYVESYNEINFLYTKYINEFKTNDSINVALNLDGTLSSISATRQGIFNDLELQVNNEQIKDFVSKYMSKNYMNLKYSILETLINQVDNKFVVETIVAIEGQNGSFTEVINYDL